MTKELIAEARERAKSPGTGSNTAQCLVELADALEDATRVPVQGEPNDEREAMLRRIESFDYDSDRVSDDLEQDIRALVALSRATVPEAATSDLTVKFDGGRCAMLNSDSRVVGYFPRFAELLAERDAATEGRLTQAELEDIAETHAFCADRLFIEAELVDEMRAERDAAVAAVERVRALADKHRSVEQHNEMVPMSDIADLIREPSSAEYLAALDGAPEPEDVWEYQWGEPGESFEGFDSFATEELARAEMELDSYYSSHRVMRRRKAGPWLPVEGEKP